MTRRLGVTRRQMMTLALTGTALAMPWVRRAGAAEPIKIGMPLALTGPLGSVGQQLRRGGEMWAKAQSANGGLLGRPIQLLIEDTGGNPADAVRKSQEMVERDKVQHPDRDHAVLRGARGRTQARRVERDFPFVG